MYNYDYKDSKSIEEYARKLVGSSLEDILGNEFEHRFKNKNSKGKLGQVVEEAYFGYKVNPNQEADFKEAGVELKVAPLKKIKIKKNANTLREKKGIAAKERIVLTIIDFMKVGIENWDNNSMMKKLSKLLLMFYMYEKDIPIEELKFELINLWSPSKADLEVIKKDWNIINEKIKLGLAHEISEGDTMYLGACTKGSTAEKSKRLQPFSEIKAPQRAFCLKNSYVNFIIDELLNRAVYIEKYKSKRDKNLDDSLKPFDEVIKEKFDGLKGLSIEEIKECLGIERERKAKHFVRLITDDIGKVLFGDKLEKFEEFNKANIELKVIVTEPNGMPKESMSFEQIDYIDIVSEKWDDSEIKSKFENKKFLWVVYKAKKNYKKQEELELSEIILDKIMFWNMPIKDLEGSMKFVWEDTVKKIKNGKYNQFIKISDDKNVHIRYKGKNCKDKALTIHNTMERKRCFWLNAKYVKNQIDNNSNY